MTLGRKPRRMSGNQSFEILVKALREIRTAALAVNFADRDGVTSAPYALGTIQVKAEMALERVMRLEIEQESTR